MNGAVTTSLDINPIRTALLVMDVQQGLVAETGPAAEDMLRRTADAIQVSRDADILVCFIGVGFRSGHPEISTANRSFGRLVGTGRMLEGRAETRFHPWVSPAEHEPIFIKRGVGAFYSTDLDQVLRANAVDTLVLTGLATSGVVLSTVRDAADRGYRTIVLRDCVTDPDPEVHDLLLARVLPRQAEVADCEQYLDGLQ